MNQINEFPRSVIEKLGYYVYLLTDPTTNKVFYVGKGTGSKISRADMAGFMLKQLHDDTYLRKAPMISN